MSPITGVPNTRIPSTATSTSHDLTVELGQDLQGFLANDDHFQTFITHDTQSWSPAFADYFKNDWNAITTWMKDAKQDMAYLISVGSTTKPVEHVYP